MNTSSLIFSQKRSILLLIALLCGLGTYLAPQLPAAIFPNTPFPRVVILMENGVVPAEEMLATVTQPVEEAMNGIPGIVRIQSVTARGSADVNLFFDWSVDPQNTLQIVQQRLSALSLPPTVNIKRVDRLTFAVFPVAGFSLVSDTRSQTQLQEIARYQIRPRLARLHGVADVAVAGGDIKEYHVRVDLEKLAARGLSLQQVIDAVSKSNVLSAPGVVSENHQFELVLVSGRALVKEQLGQIVVTNSTGASVHVRDVAEVVDGVKPRFNIVSADGRPAVLLNVLRQPSANTVAVTDEVKQEIKAIRADLPKDIKIAPYYDQSIMVKDSMLGVRDAILLGLLLSVLILFGFLKDLRTTAIAVLVIPATVSMTLLGMKLMGFSYNLMTLGGIAAAIGLVIDDAVVMVENIHSHRQLESHLRDAVRAALSEVTKPIIVSTITPVVVFLPLTLLSGVAGVFFRSMALTMTIALLTSLFFALTLTPILADSLLKSSGLHQDQEDGFLLKAFKGLYERVLRVCLRHKWLVVATAALAVTLTVGVWSRLGTEFLPAFDEGAFVLDYYAPPGSTLEETYGLLNRVEKILLKTPEVESYSLRVGLQLGLSNTAPNTGDFLVKLKQNRNRTTEEVIDDIRSQIEATDPVLSVEFAGILNDLIGDLSSSPSPVEIRLYHEDTALLHAKAREVQKVLDGIEGIVDTNSGIVESGPSVTFRVIPDRANTFSTDTAEIANALTTVLTGTEASTILEGPRVRTVRVTTKGGRQSSLADLGNIPLSSSSGVPYRLSQVAELAYGVGETELERNGLRKCDSVTARVSGVDLGTAINRVKKALAAQVNIPSGMTVEYGGIYAQQQQTFREMSLSLVLAITLVFLVLLVDFRSFMAAVSIMVGATLSLCGVLWALWLTGMTLNIVSFMGMIMVVGIVAKNGILLLDALHLDRPATPGTPRSADLQQAVLAAGRRRFRPVLMTSLAAILGMLPLAVALGAGAELLQPLAIAVIGGLCLSIPLSLILTPVMFVAMRRNRNI